MLIDPISYKRGDSLSQVEESLVGAIGAFSQACLDRKNINQPLEVLLLQGDKRNGFFARLGNSHHQILEGKLSHAKISFTLEAFSIHKEGDPLKNLKKDSLAFFSQAKKELREAILTLAQKNKIEGALLYVKGTAKEIHTYAHTDPKILNDQTKTFDHPKGLFEIEGWGNLSFIDGGQGLALPGREANSQNLRSQMTPFVHVHGTYATARDNRFGGHFIMDDKTPLVLEKAEILIYPTTPLIRTMQGESFPTLLRA